MQLGISIDAQDSVSAIPFIQNWSGILQHIQFYLNANLSPEDAKSISKVVRSFETRLTYSFHAYGYLNPAEENHQVRSAWIDVGKKSIDFLSELGGKFINFHIGYLLSSSYDRAEALCNAYEAITALCDYAAPKHIDINIENDYSSEHISRLGDRPEDIQFFISRRPQNLHICFDIGHANISFPSPYLYRDWLDVIQSFHIHNNNGRQDEHIPAGGPGTIKLESLYEDISGHDRIYGILENDFSDYEAGLTHVKHLLDL